MKHLLHALVPLLAAAPIAASAQDTTAEISGPARACVETDQMTTIEGTYRGDGVRIVPFVNPASHPNWWVQPDATLLDDDEWAATIYLGRPGMDFQDFHAVVAVNPRRPVETGQQMPRLPDADHVSPAVVLEKRRSGGC